MRFSELLRALSETCTPPMKTVTAMLLLTATISIAADAPRIAVEARYNGFDAKLFSEVHPGYKSDKQNQPLVAPRVLTKSGQRCVIEIIREVKVPGAQPIAAGVTVEVTPTLLDGQLMLTGKSTIRHLLNRGADQPLGAVSFTTRETFFSGPIEHGKPITIRVADGTADQAEITLVAKLVPATAAKAP